MRVLFQADGRKYRNPYEVDLAKELSGNYQNSAVTRSVGDHAEELARQYLEKQGLITGEQNYRTKFGN